MAPISGMRSKLVAIVVLLGLITATAGGVPTGVAPAAASTQNGSTPAITGDSPSAKVTRLYQAFFLRTPATEARTYWVSQLNTGSTLADIADLFAASDEFDNTYGALSDTQFVDLIYRNVLDRDREPNELYWIDELSSNRLSRGGVMVGFSESPEFSNLLLDRFDDSSVFRLYCAYFLRTPETEGRSYWKALAAGGLPLNDISEQFSISGEFASRYGQLNNASFVTLIYRNILQREPESAGFAYWTSELTNGRLGRGEVVTAFSESPEYINLVPDEGSPIRTYVPPTSNVIFESDFSQDTGYHVGQTTLWNGGSNDPVEPPTGWDGVLVTGNGSILVETGVGVGGSNALILIWDPDMSQPVLSLGKHLTGDINTGFDEIYVRYQVRFPNNFRVGESAAGIEHWKWGRLWQNTDPTTGWTENRPNSHYVVWNFGGNIPYTDVNVVWGENTGDGRQLGSAGGPRQGLDFFRSGSDQHNSPGYFESLWPINDTNRPGTLENNTSQNWHTLEFRFKLATTPTSDDGVFEMWWDGINQGPYSRIGGGGGTPNRTGIPTARMGSGFNFFTFFDNLVGWNSDWSDLGVDGFIFVNDVVVSADYIGADYIVGQ